MTRSRVSCNVSPQGQPDTLPQASLAKLSQVLRVSASSCRQFQISLISFPSSKESLSGSHRPGEHSCLRMGRLPTLSGSPRPTHPEPEGASSGSVSDSTSLSDPTLLSSAAWNNSSTLAGVCWQEILVSHNFKRMSVCASVNSGTKVLCRPTLPSAFSGLATAPHRFHSAPGASSRPCCLTVTGLPIWTCHTLDEKPPDYVEMSTLHTLRTADLRSHQPNPLHRGLRPQVFLTICAGADYQVTFALELERGAFSDWHATRAFELGNNAFSDGWPCVLLCTS